MQTASFFIIDKEIKKGPYTKEQILILFDQGKITSKDRICKVNKKNYLTYNIKLSPNLVKINIRESDIPPPPPLEIKKMLEDKPFSKTRKFNLIMAVIAIIISLLPLGYMALFNYKSVNINDNSIFLDIYKKVENSFKRVELKSISTLNVDPIEISLTSKPSLKLRDLKNNFQFKFGDNLAYGSYQAQFYSYKNGQKSLVNSEILWHLPEDMDKKAFFNKLKIKRKDWKTFYKKLLKEEENSTILLELINELIVAVELKKTLKEEYPLKVEQFIRRTNYIRSFIKTEYREKLPNLFMLATSLYSLVGIYNKNLNKNILTDIKALKNKVNASYYLVKRLIIGHKKAIDIV